MALTRGNSTKSDLYAEIRLLKQEKKDAIKIAKAKLGATFAKRFATYNKNKNKRIFSAKRRGYRDFDGIFSFITIVRYSDRVELTPKQFCYISLLNLVNRVRVKDAAVYWLGTRPAAYWMLNKLCELGYAEKFKQNECVYYYASIKAKKVFEGYQSFHNKGLKVMEQYDEYKQQRNKWRDKRLGEVSK